MPKTQELLEKLEKKIEQVKDSKEFKEMLNFFSKFHSYSYHNTILILMQNPKATYVAGYKQWQKKYNRFVKKGEKGIAILAPFTKKITNNKEKTKKEEEEDDDEITIKKTYFRPVYVFDISQTKGSPIPKIDLSLKDNFNKILKPLREFTLDNGISLNFMSLSDSLKGYSKGGNIVVDITLNDTEKACILLHELAHELLHYNLNRNNLTKEIKEIEAEAVAFVVMNHYGIEIKSDKYLALYKKSYNLKESLNHISNVSSSIINYCNNWLK